MALSEFSEKIINVGGNRIVHIPLEVSKAFPSRGMVMGRGTVGGFPVDLALEPDGKGSHWFMVSESLFAALGADENEMVTVALDILDEWYEPDVPNDLYQALESADLVDTWLSLTTKARWEWIRWIRFTNNPDTRKKRIDVTCSKLESGKRRPCCFDLSRCTDTSVSKNGVLLD